jgi:hypothetical protein
MPNWSELPADLASDWEQRYFSAVKAFIGAQPASRLKVEAISLADSYPRTSIVARLRLADGPEFVGHYPLWSDSYQESSDPDPPDSVALMIVTDMFENTAC